MFIQVLIKNVLTQKYIYFFFKKKKGQTEAAEMTP